MKSLMMSQKIFNMNIIAKNINFLSSPNPISGSARMSVVEQRKLCSPTA